MNSLQVALLNLVAFGLIDVASADRDTRSLRARLIEE
jgi:hypothetical protein